MNKSRMFLDRVSQWMRSKLLSIVMYSVRRRAYTSTPLHTVYTLFNDAVWFLLSFDLFFCVIDDRQPLRPGDTGADCWTRIGRTIGRQCALRALMRTSFVVVYSTDVSNGRGCPTVGRSRSPIKSRPSVTVDKRHASLPVELVHFPLFCPKETIRNPFPSRIIMMTFDGGW